MPQAPGKEEQRLSQPLTRSLGACRGLGRRNKSPVSLPLLQQTIQRFSFPCTC